MGAQKCLLASIMMVLVVHINGLPYRFYRRSSAQYEHQHNHHGGCSHGDHHHGHVGHHGHGADYQGYGEFHGHDGSYHGHHGSNHGQQGLNHGQQGQYHGHHHQQQQPNPQVFQTEKPHHKPINQVPNNNRPELPINSPPPPISQQPITPANDIDSAIADIFSNRDDSKQVSPTTSVPSNIEDDTLQIDIRTDESENIPVYRRPDGIPSISDLFLQGNISNLP